MQTESLFTGEASSNVSGAMEQVIEPPVGVLSVGVFKNETAAEQPAQKEVKPMKSGNWFLKILNVVRRKKTAVAPGAPVQTEWSLDRVKVVRNDLSDVDLDIVFASVDSNAAAKKAPAKKEKLVGSAWRRVNPNPTKQEQMVLK